MKNRFSRTMVGLLLAAFAFSAQASTSAVYEISVMDGQAAMTCAGAQPTSGPCYYSYYSEQWGIWAGYHSYAYAELDYYYSQNLCSDPYYAGTCNFWSNEYYESMQIMIHASMMAELYG